MTVDLVKRLRSGRIFSRQEAADRIEQLIRLDNEQVKHIAEHAETRRVAEAHLSEALAALKKIGEIAWYYIDGDEDAHGTIVKIATLARAQGNAEGDGNE